MRRLARYVFFDPPETFYNISNTFPFQIIWRPKLEIVEVEQLVLAADIKAIGAAANEYLAAQ